MTGVQTCALPISGFGFAFLLAGDDLLDFGVVVAVAQFAGRVDVLEGEHGITIIAPTPYKKKIEEQKLDPDTKATILDEDGKIVTEEKEIEIPMFGPVKVFDVSQTDGKPLPELASSLSGNVV